MAGFGGNSLDGTVTERVEIFLTTRRGHVLSLCAADFGSPTCLKHGLRVGTQMQERLDFSLLPFVPVATPWVPGHESEPTKRSNYSQPSARRRHLPDHASTAQHCPAMPFSLQHLLTTCQSTDRMPQHVIQASRPPQPMGDEAGVRTTQRLEGGRQQQREGPRCTCLTTSTPSTHTTKFAPQISITRGAALVLTGQKNASPSRNHENSPDVLG
jgi:hypothetical protein